VKWKTLRASSTVRLWYHAIWCIWCLGATAVAVLARLPLLALFDAAGAIAAAWYWQRILDRRRAETRHPVP
jgi:hypothetical protein